MTTTFSRRQNTAWSKQSRRGGPVHTRVDTGRHSPTHGAGEGGNGVPRLDDTMGEPILPHKGFLCLFSLLSGKWMTKIPNSIAAAYEYCEINIVMPLVFIVTMSSVERVQQGFETFCVLSFIHESDRFEIISFYILLFMTVSSVKWGHVGHYGGSIHHCW